MVVLGRRFANDRKATYRLSDEQVQTIAAFQAEKPELSSVPCTICGENDFVPVAEKDRYGFEYRTGICQACGSFQVTDYYSPKILDAFYSKYYRKIYEGTTPEQLFRTQRDRRAPHIFDYLAGKIAPTARILEVGCGAGGLVAYFGDRGHDAVGLDLNKEYLQYGRSQGLNLVLEDMNEYQPEEKFDLVVLADVAEHFADPVSALRHLKSFLRPDGMLFIEVPGLASVPSRYSGDLLRYFQNAHVSNFTAGTFRNLARVAGYDVVDANDAIQALLAPSDNPEGIQNVFASVCAELEDTEKQYQRNKSSFFTSHLRKSLKRRWKNLFR